MCGITGVISRNFDKTKLRGMTGALYQRGPDETGYYESDPFYCGHARLKIIDLKTGQQPMLSSDSRYCVIFNGEIYNYQTIRKNLAANGTIFKTSSDTEVLLHSFMQNGPACLQEFNGMFAFSVYDSAEKSLFLARDRIGIKPLFYALTNDGIVFGSTIKSILRSGKINPEPDYTVLSNYLTHFRQLLGSRTLFKNIYSLEPGHFLIYKNGNCTIKKWWELTQIPEIEKNDFGEQHYAEQVRTLLEKAVDYRMISDVPLGAYLSGGVDSSILVSIMAKKASSSLKTFSIGFEDTGFNEFEYSDIISRQFETEHTRLTMKPADYMPLLHKVIEAKDMPLTVPNEVPLARLSEELKKHITVVLSGEGSDELFAGYDLLFRAPFDVERFRMLCQCPDWLEPHQKMAFLNNLGKLYSYQELSNPVSHHLSLYQWIRHDERRSILQDSLISERSEIDIIQYYFDYFGTVPRLTSYDKILYFFERSHLTALLERLDNATMYASVEGRVPFVDHELVEAVFAMPFHYKLRCSEQLSCLMTKNAAEISAHDTGKYILRKAFDGAVPDKVLQRKKFSFPVPLDEFFTGPLKKEMLEILHDSSARAIIKTNAVDTWIDSIAAPKGLKIWQLMNAVLWHKKYFVDKTWE